MENGDFYDFIRILGDCTEYIAGLAVRLLLILPISLSFSDINRYS